MAPVEIDRLDSRILRELRADARISHVTLAERVGLSATACARRIRQLEQAKIIKAYRAELDAAALGYRITVVVQITLEKQSENFLSQFEAAVARCPNVISCHLMSGTNDYVLHVVARDIEDFEEIHKRHLSRLPGVARINSSFAIRQIVDRTISEAATDLGQ